MLKIECKLINILFRSHLDKIFQYNTSSTTYIGNASSIHESTSKTVGIEEFPCGRCTIWVLEVVFKHGYSYIAHFENKTENQNPQTYFDAKRNK